MDYDLFKFSIYNITMRQFLKEFFTLVTYLLLFIVFLNFPSIIAADNQWEILRKELQLNFNETTDDTTPTMTFITNPNTELKITLDNQKEFNQPTSPLILPKLSFGIHRLEFEYKTNKNIKRTVTVTFSVVPPSPIINKQKTLFIKPEPLFLKGTAMAGSKVMLIINSQEVHFVTPEENGEWYLPLEKTQLGKYNIMAYTYHYGIISKEPDKVTLEYKLPKQQPEQHEIRETSLYDQLRIYKNTFYGFLNQNKQTVIVIAIILVAVLLLLLLIYIKIRAKHKLEEKPLSELLKTKPNILSYDSKIKSNDSTRTSTQPKPDHTKKSHKNKSPKKVPTTAKGKTKKPAKAKTPKKTTPKSKGSLRKKEKQKTKTSRTKLKNQKHETPASTTIDIVKGGKISIE